jgi:hypothetical protein
MTETTQTEEIMSLALQQRSKFTITQQFFGVAPYVIVRPAIEDTEIVFNIEAGGGATLDTVADLFEGLVDLLRSPETVEGIEGAMSAAREAAEVDDDEDLDEALDEDE